MYIHLLGVHSIVARYTVGRLKCRVFDRGQGPIRYLTNFLLFNSSPSSCPVSITMAPTPPKTRRKTCQKKHSPHTRGRIAMAYSKGTEIINIAKELSIPKTSVHGLLKPYITQERGKSKPRAGHTDVLSEHDKRYVQRAARIREESRTETL